MHIIYIHYIYITIHIHTHIYTYIYPPAHIHVFLIVSLKSGSPRNPTDSLLKTGELVKLVYNPDHVVMRTVMITA